MTLWHGYDGFSGTCAGHAQPGNVALMSWFLGAYKARGGTNLGIYGCRLIAGTGSPSIHGDGRADDLGCPVVNDWSKPLADWLVANSGELGIQCVIHQRQIWSGSYPDAGFRPYNGVDPHTGHLHVETSWWGAEHLTVDLLNSLANGDTPMGSRVYLQLTDSTPFGAIVVSDGIRLYKFPGNEAQFNAVKAKLPGEIVKIPSAELPLWGDVAAGGVLTDHAHILPARTGGVAALDLP